MEDYPLTDHVKNSPIMNYLSGNFSRPIVMAVSLMDTMVHDPDKTVTTEDRGMTAASLIFVNMPEHFWCLLFAVGVILVVWFLSKVSINDQAEDMTFYQALPIAVLWATLGIALILFNKFIFLPSGFGFDFPYTVFLMWWHMLCGTIASNVLRVCRPSMMPAVTSRKLGFQSYLVNIFPIAGLQSVALALGNTAYLYISVAYIQMVKNTTSAFVFMFSIMLGLEKGTFSSTFAVFTVVIGLLLTTVGELDFSLLGFVFQMAGTLSDSLRLTMTKIVMSSNHSVKLDPMSTLYYASPTMLLLLSVPMYVVDLPYLTFEKVWRMKFVLLANALLAFGLNMTSMFFMKRCGATTYALTGVLKDVVLILLCCALFGHPLTATQLLGFCISMAGFQVYNNLKSDPACLVKVWYSMRGVEYHAPLCENSPLVSSPEDGIKSKGDLKADMLASPGSLKCTEGAAGSLCRSTT